MIRVILIKPFWEIPEIVLIPLGFLESFTIWLLPVDESITGTFHNKCMVIQFAEGLNIILFKGNIIELTVGANLFVLLGSAGLN
jgi:hypothetical protein